MKNSYETITVSPVMPWTFVLRRLHSVLGFFLVFFLFEHLLTNSQGAFLFGADGKGFIDGVNLIHSLPYLPVIELALIAVPFLIHGIWGVIYTLTSSPNCYPTDGSRPALYFSRNHAYTWQRITALLLIFGVVAHVMHMRMNEYPRYAKVGSQNHYMVKISMDEGLYTLAPRLNVSLFDRKSIDELESSLLPTLKSQQMNERNHSLHANRPLRTLDPALAHTLSERTLAEEKLEWVRLLSSRYLGRRQVIASAPDFGTACLLTVRDAFKSIPLAILYSLFVIVAVFHAMNGVWTFAITWGVTLTERSRVGARHVTSALMFLLIFLGLGAIWGCYWINLKN
jgi:succinate dehydrogenase / fumarate reductase cytochrome b subunit